MVISFLWSFKNPRLWETSLFFVLPTYVEINLINVNRRLWETSLFFVLPTYVEINLINVMAGLYIDEILQKSTRCTSTVSANCYVNCSFTL